MFLFGLSESLALSWALKRKQWEDHCGAWEPHWTVHQGTGASGEHLERKSRVSQVPSEEPGSIASTCCSVPRAILLVIPQPLQIVPVSSSRCLLSVIDEIYLISWVSFAFLKFQQESHSSFCASSRMCERGEQTGTDGAAVRLSPARCGGLAWGVTE